MSETSEELFLKYKNESDALKKDDILNALFKKNEGFIHYTARKFKNSKLPYDEIVNLAVVGMVKSLNTYNPESSKFITYSSLLMTNEILMEIRKAEYKKALISIETPIGDGNAFLKDVIEDSGVNFEKSFEDSNLIHTILKNAKNILKDKEFKVVLNELRDKPKTQKELGLELGLSQAQISRMHRKAFVKIKKSVNT